MTLYALRVTNLRTRVVGPCVCVWCSPEFPTLAKGEKKLEQCARVRERVARRPEDYRFESRVLRVLSDAPCWHLEHFFFYILPAVSPYQETVVGKDCILVSLPRISWV